MINEKDMESMLIDIITEVIKGPVEVKWTKGFGVGTGYFNVGDEQYEIEFDEVDTRDCAIRGMKFFRIIDNNRKIKYTASKEPYCVASTVKEQVQKYIEHFKPDIFGYMGDLEEKPRLRHYLRMIQDLEKNLNFIMMSLLEMKAVKEYLFFQNSKIIKKH